VAGPFRGSPAKWKPADSEAILRALQDDEASPVACPLGRLARTITAGDRHQSADGVVIVPDDDADSTGQPEPAESTHTEIHYLLIKLGTDRATSIYSRLLRMSDLLACQPNISVPLFLVAPEERRAQVIRQANRPTFERMKPPFVDVRRYISFEGLRDALAAAQDHISYLKPGWLQSVS